MNIATSSKLIYAIRGMIDKFKCRANICFIDNKYHATIFYKNKKLQIESSSFSEIHRMLTEMNFDSILKSA